MRYDESLNWGSRVGNREAERILDVLGRIPKELTDGLYMKGKKERPGDTWLLA